MVEVTGVKKEEARNGIRRSRLYLPRTVGQGLLDKASLPSSTTTTTLPFSMLVWIAMGDAAMITVVTG